MLILGLLLVALAIAGCGAQRRSSHCNRDHVECYAYDDNTLDAEWMPADASGRTPDRFA